MAQSQLLGSLAGQRRQVAAQEGVGGQLFVQLPRQRGLPLGAAAAGWWGIREYSRRIEESVHHPQEISPR